MTDKDLSETNEELHKISHQIQGLSESINIAHKRLDDISRVEKTIEDLKQRIRNLEIVVSYENFHITNGRLEHIETKITEHNEEFEKLKEFHKGFSYDVPLKYTSLSKVVKNG